MKTELDKRYELAYDTDTVMMTTSRPDGHVQLRAMAHQKRADGAGLWFVTADGSDTLHDLTADPRLNLANPGQPS